MVLIRVVTADLYPAMIAPRDAEVGPVGLESLGEPVGLESLVRATCSAPTSALYNSVDRRVPSEGRTIPQISLSGKLIFIHV